MKESIRGMVALVCACGLIGNAYAMEYRVTDLGTLGGSNSSAGSINASGQVVGTADLVGDAVAHAFVYSGGIMSDLGTGKKKKMTATKSGVDSLNPGLSAAPQLWALL